MRCGCASLPSASVFLFLLGPAIYIGTYIADQHMRERPKATEFPGRAIAEQLTREWREKTGTQLHYVAGTEFAANNVAVYSPIGRMSSCMAARRSVPGSTWTICESAAC